MRTTIICDSRGSGLQQLLKLNQEIGDAKIIQFKGAGSQRATRLALPVIAHSKPDLVILMTGICDLTTRNHSTKITSVKDLGQHELMENVISEIKIAVGLLNQCGCSNISVATVTGINLIDYNNPERKRMDPSQYETYRRHCKPLDDKQEIIDTTILLINKAIVSINRKNKSPTTWTANAVHAYFKKAYHHYYKHLQDGCHATTRTKQYWANQIARTIKIFKSRSDEKDNN